MSKFTERLKELRHERDVTQAKLGQYLEVGYTAIANYESGRNEPSIDTLVKIAKYFDVTADYLIGLEEKQERDFSITKREAELLEAYSKLQEDQKGILLDLVQSMLSKES